MEKLETLKWQNVRIPSPEEISSLEFEELHEIWRGNNEIYLSHLSVQRPRYFGLHGTPRKNLNMMQQTKTANIEIGTFFNKNIALEFLLSALYAMCEKTSYYAFCQSRAENDQGGIMVVDVEEEGNNKTWPAWEDLIMSNYNPIELEFYTEEDLFLLHNNHPNHPLPKEDRAQRSAIILTPVSFDSRLIGIYEWEQQKKFCQRFSGPESLARTTLQRNLNTQDILKFCLETMHVL